MMVVESLAWTAQWGLKVKPIQVSIGRQADRVRLLGSIYALSILLTTSLPQPAVGSPIDIPTITCGAMADWTVEERYDVFVFFLGYYGGTTKSIKFDDELIEPFANKFEKWCLANPEANILENVRTIFESN